MSKKFTVNGSFGNGTAVNGNKGRVFAVAQMMNDDNEAEIEFELFEMPIFGSSGLAEDVDNVVFAKLITQVK
jgi:hypothetical protein